MKHATIRKPASPGRLAVILTSAVIGLAACGDEPAATGNAGADVAPASGSAVVDQAIADKPCEFVTTAMVAQTFGIPAAEVVQENYSNCTYAWEGSENSLDVSVNMGGVYESAADAERNFRLATRSMTSGEVAEAMDAVRTQAESSGEPGTTGERDAADGVSNALGSQAIQFADVENVGDAARIKTDTGELTVLQDNLVFTISAYYGSGEMPMPEKITAASMMAASKAWTQATFTERREAAVKLAQAAINAIQ